MPSAKDFCNPMQIVKVEPLAKINAIFFACARARAPGAAEYNIDGFDTKGGGRRKEYSVREYSRSHIPRLL